MCVTAILGVAFCSSQIFSPESITVSLTINNDEYSVQHEYLFPPPKNAAAFEKFARTDFRTSLLQEVN